MYLTDVGILTAMMGFRAKKDILDNTFVGFAKGGLYKNAIAQQLVSRGYTPYYYQKSSQLGENVGVADKKITLPHYMSMFV